MELETDKKRKRNDASSVSDTSLNISSKQEDKEIRDKYSLNTSKDKKKDKKKKRRGDKDDTTDDSASVDNVERLERRMHSNEQIMTSINNELKEINLKMEKVTTTKEIEKVFKQLFEKSIESMATRIKEEVYNSVSHRIDIVEGEIHTLNTEKDKLTKEVKTVKAELEEKKNEINSLHDKLDTARNHYIKRSNELEQYTRKNSVRLSGPGLPIEDTKESAAETTTAAVGILNSKLGLHVTEKDIDIAHRIGIMRQGQPRGIIVKFTSRLSKIAALKDKRTKLRGTGIYVQEDLTQLNAKVLKTVRDSVETESAWTFEGQIYAKYKANGNVEKVKFEDFEQWLH